MRKIKVLVVDDSAVIRKVLGDCLAADPEIEVIGTAANGRLALEQLPLVQPDIITLDIEMPEMDGLETIQHVRKNYPNLPIIMCSSLTAAGAAHTLDALALGASDYVTKPSSHGVNTRDVVGAELIQKIKGLATQRLSPGPESINKPIPPLASGAPNSIVAKKPREASSPTGPIEVVAVGVSTGGPNALSEVLQHLPAQLLVPLLIVQHMPPLFTKLLAERLGAQCRLPVCEAQHGQEVRPGTVYLAPGGFHMEVKRSLGRVLVVLSDGPPENSCKPAVDVLFRSVARVYGARALGAILTGMGQDGLKGCQEIHAVGGYVLAQDRETSAVWGMPGAVIEAGLASAVVPLQRVAGEIAHIVTPGCI